MAAAVRSSAKAIAVMGHIIGNAKIPDGHAGPGIASSDADYAPALAVLPCLSCGLVEFQRAPAWRPGARQKSIGHYVAVMNNSVLPATIFSGRLMAI